MRLGHYHFHCRLHDDACLPPYKGSTFRGAFGHALRQTVCTLRRQECPSCLLQQSCIYARVFETKRPDDSVRHLASPPHPYVIRPPATEARQLPAGSAFDFSLLLFGDFNDALPYFIYAFERMGSLGIGKGKARFTIERVDCAGQAIYRQGSSTLAPLPPLDSLQLVPATGKPGDLRLRLRTPLRVKAAGRFVRTLDFATLTRAALRRLSALLAAYGDGDPDLPYADLIRQAEQVRLVADHSRWHEWTRYSNRQNESMQFGGLIGELHFAEVPAFHRHLLELAGKVHLGKQTSFGLGRIQPEVA